MGQLYACDDELHAQHQPRKVQRDVIEVALGIEGVVEGSQPVGGVRGEDDAGDQGDEGFGQVEAFFEQVGDQAEEEDEAAQHGGDGVEGVKVDGRHCGSWSWYVRRMGG